MANRITAALLNRLKTSLGNGDTIKAFLADNELDIPIQRLRVAYDNKFGSDALRDTMMERGKKKLDSVEKCDSRIAKLNKMIEEIEAIKQKLM